MYHVTSRGNCGAAIFIDDLDRLSFLERLGRTTGDFHWATLAYCLMGNHVHLQIRTPEANIARGMRSLNGWYAQRFNARHDRTGHVFEGPYYADLIDTDAHMLETSRYIVRNPVRARLCRHPEDWPWSSHRSAIGLAPTPAWLATQELLEPFGKEVARAGARYRRFVDEGVDRPLRPRSRTRSGGVARFAMSRDQVPGHVLLG